MAPKGVVRLEDIRTRGGSLVLRTVKLLQQGAMGAHTMVMPGHSICHANSRLPTKKPRKRFKESRFQILQVTGSAQVGALKNLDLQLV